MKVKGMYSELQQKFKDMEPLETFLVPYLSEFPSYREDFLKRMLRKIKLFEEYFNFANEIQESFSDYFEDSLIFVCDSCSTKILFDMDSGRFIFIINESSLDLIIKVLSDYLDKDLIRSYKEKSPLLLIEIFLPHIKDKIVSNINLINRTLSKKDEKEFREKITKFEKKLKRKLRNGK